ncbi:hypothetical protein GDO86_017606 [Hymenochirus boettgeri]|uniref:PH domain-containing protein n=1 Tax=Hymenochirus boettgeri TaxID=247094 RepID=A0A8T2IT90_9PIPI|nr:hypothetical protein GDO86_017606 [Hymenochirus boettgeri]
MDWNAQTSTVYSGILEKRRAKLKFHWRVYNFVLKGTTLSYYKVHERNQKEGEPWGTINMRDVLSLNPIEAIGHRYPIEITLRSGKVVLLSADCNLERIKWIQALQEKMAELRKSKRPSETPVVREKSGEFGRVVCEWMAKSSPSDGFEPTVSKEAGTDGLDELDSFIDQTFSGITFNGKTQLMKKGTQEQNQDQDCYQNKT